MTTSPMLQPAGTLRGGGASRGDARWHDGSAIVVGNGWPCNCDEQQWQQWATVVVTMEDSNCGGTIVMSHNGGGAIDGGRAVQS
jgi:hypothetical protein